MLWLALLGCVRGPVNNFTLHRVIPEALRVGDVDRVCRTGGALGYALAALPKRPAHRALVIADVTAALCDEAAARETELQTLVLGHALTGAGAVSVQRDGRERERRLRQRAAARFHAGWQHAEAVWPWMGQACEPLDEDDELAYLIGLMGGTLGMLNDKASGSVVGVPLDTLARVGRASTCVDDARWWGVPATFEAAAWTLVPGSAPEGLDPWAELERRAAAGSDQGVRLGWALAAVLAANAGRDDLVTTAITASAASFAAHPAPAEWLLLDAYSRQVLQHEADLLAIREQGYRPTGLTVPMPEPVATPAAENDPFADPVPEPDPFAEEP